MKIFMIIQAIVDFVMAIIGVIVIQVGRKKRDMSYAAIFGLFAACKFVVFSLIFGLMLIFK